MNFLPNGCKDIASAVIYMSCTKRVDQMMKIQQDIMPSVNKDYFSNQLN